MKYNIVKLWLKWKYRKIDENICCCGGDIRHTSSSCIASCRSAKEYAMTSEEKKILTK